MHFDWPIPAFISSALLGRSRNYRNILYICSTIMVFYEKICLKERNLEEMFFTNNFVTRISHNVFLPLFYPRPVTYVYYLYHQRYHQGSPCPLRSIKWILVPYKTEVFCWYLILAVYKLFRIPSIIKRTIVQKVGRCHLWFSKEIF